MPAPSVTFTLVNGTTIRASDHNTNFQDLINSMTDGTKDFSINSLAVVGGVTCNTLTPTTVNGDVIMTGSPTVSGELKGSRGTLLFSAIGLSTSDAFIGVGTSSATNEFSYKMSRAGSIVGYSVTGFTTAFTSNLAIIYRIRKNAATVASSNTLTWTANSQAQADTATIARGSNTFAAGDTISLQWDFQSGNATVSTVANYIEIQFNT